MKFIYVGVKNEFSSKSGKQLSLFLVLIHAELSQLSDELKANISV
jgi:hypothetical protein